MSYIEPIQEINAVMKESPTHGTVIADVVQTKGTSTLDVMSQNAVSVELNANLADLAATYSATSTYAVGDYVIYNGQLYRCTTAISTAEAWTAAHWTSVTVGSELKTKESTANKVTSINAQSTDTQYPSAKCVYDETNQLKEDLVDLETAFNALGFSVVNGALCVTYNI